MDNLGNLSGLLGPIINDPDTMAKLRDVAAGLGIGNQSSGGESPNVPDVPDNGPPAQESPASSAANPLNAGAIGDLLSSVGPIGDLLSSPEIGKLLSRAAPVLTEKETDSTRLLFALEPFLQESRRGKLHEALQIMKILRVVAAVLPEGTLPIKL